MNEAGNLLKKLGETNYSIQKLSKRNDNFILSKILL